LVALGQTALCTSSQVNFHQPLSHNASDKMGGRQAHGRSLMTSGSGPGAGNKRKQQRSKARSNKKALDAFSIASREVGEKNRQTPRNRELDADVGGGKRSRRDEDDNDDEDDEDDEAPPRKVMRRGAREQDEDQDVEYGSDSSGNEWRVGVCADDDDSELDSDEAFGESDDERFQGYAFGSSKKKKRSKGGNDDEDSSDEDDEDDDADGASLGSDAIDLAAALDQSMSDDDDVEGEEGEDSDDESGSDDSESDEVSADSEDDVSESGVKDWVKKFGGEDEDEEEAPAPKKAKIDLQDLGLLGVSDPQLKKSLKLMSKEEKSSKPQKLEVPLARRQQAQLDRAAAYEQTNKTLDRWNETVKQNRRAEHLVFPLPQTETGLARHDNSEIAPMNRQAPGTELERTILGIMEESGLGPKPKNEVDDLDENGESISRKELQSLWQAKRRERELKSREEARAKRIKKIKSKAYHRVHRKERERNEIKEHEAMMEAGEVDSEDEREARDRQRAAERMGARHKDSKWAKMAKKGGLAVWDDSVREGMADMARRDQELRRRVEGRGQDSDDDYDYSGDSEDGDDRKQLLKQLQEIQDSEDAPSKSKLMNMAFMQKAEATKRKENDELIAQIRRDLASDDEEFDGSEPEADDIGRRRYGVPGANKEPTVSSTKKQKSKGDKSEPSAAASASKTDVLQSVRQPTFRELAAEETGGAWSSAAPSKPGKKQRGKKSDTSANVLDLDSSFAVVKAPEPAAKPKSSRQPQHATTYGDDTSSDDEDGHNIQFHEQDLLDKAFGGLDVVADFEAEKRAMEEEDDEKIIDNTLPGWGSWVGDGLSAREKKRHQGRFLTKQEGVQKDKRKDAKLDKVIISEKRTKKVRKPIPCIALPDWQMLTCQNLEHQVPGLPDAARVRVSHAVRARSPSPSRPRMGHQEDAPGGDQAQSDDQAGHHRTYGEAHALDVNTVFDKMWCGPRYPQLSRQKNYRHDMNYQHIFGHCLSDLFHGILI
jgi:U3 small nucleolar RNA-associated protein 14